MSLFSSHMDKLLLVFSCQIKLPKLLLQGRTEPQDGWRTQTCIAERDRVRGVVTLTVTCLDSISLNKEANVFVDKCLCL